MVGFACTLWKARSLSSEGAWSCASDMFQTPLGEARFLKKKCHPHLWVEWCRLQSSPKSFNPNFSGRTLGTGCTDFVIEASRLFTRSFKCQKSIQHPKLVLKMCLECFQLEKLKNQWKSSPKSLNWNFSGRIVKWTHPRKILPENFFFEKSFAPN